MHWADGWETKLGNLITLCSYHHRLVHEGGFGLSVTDDGLFVFTRPDGRPVEANGARRFSGNVVPLGELSREAGLDIDARTSRCRWLGEPMDYSMAIEAMQWLEQRAREAAAAARPSSTIGA